MNRMQLYLFAAPLLLVSMTGVSFAGSATDMIMPGTAQATEVISQLDHAARIDRLNAQSYQGSDFSSAGTYYYHKAQDAEALASTLRGNRPISIMEFRHALNTSHAVRFTDGY